MKRHQKQMHNPYRWGRLNNFRELFKKVFFAWRYGNFKAEQLHDDCYLMYDMGGEL